MKGNKNKNKKYDGPAFIYSAINSAEASVYSLLILTLVSFILFMKLSRINARERTRIWLMMLILHGMVDDYMYVCVNLAIKKSCYDEPLLEWYIYFT